RSPGARPRRLPLAFLARELEQGLAMAGRGRPGFVAARFQTAYEPVEIGELGARDVHLLLVLEQLRFRVREAARQRLQLGREGRDLTPAPGLGPAALPSARLRPARGLLGRAAAHLQLALGGAALLVMAKALRFERLALGRRRLDRQRQLGELAAQLADLLLAMEQSAF